MSHFFAEGSLEAAYLSDEDMAHALKSLRLKEGEEITLALDGKRYAARFSAANRYTLSDPLPDTEPGITVTLYQGIPKADKMDMIVQACTQGGVSRIVPVAFKRCVSIWDQASAVKKTARLQRIALEAAKQSGRCRVPEILPPVTSDRIDPGAYDAALLPWEESARHGMGGLRSWWAGRAHKPLSAAIIIGPEGGISSEEASMLIKAGACPVSLGPRIFRTETAGFAALAALLALAGELG